MNQRQTDHGKQAQFAHTIAFLHRGMFHSIGQVKRLLAAPDLFDDGSTDLKFRMFDILLLQLPGGLEQGLTSFIE